MNKSKLKIYVALALLFGIIVTGCYKEEHFDFPGPYEDSDSTSADSLPFPFDKNREAGVWLMKDGVPDYEKILFKGYTDFYAKGDTLSWVKKSDGLHLLPHYNYYPLSNADHFAGDANAYKYNWAYSKYFVPIGPGKNFYFYTKVTFGTMSATAVGLSLGISWSNGKSFVFGMDGASTAGEPKFFIDLYGTTVSVNPDLGWPTIPQVLIPGIPADLEVIIVDGLFYMKVNDILVFKFKLPSENLYYYTPQVRPWRNFVSVHDMYIESNDMYSVDYAMHEQEGGYALIQAPALAKAANGDLVLFAEGRSNPADVYARIAQNTMSVGDCDIVMKRSSDGGTTWDKQLTVLAGAGEGTTYCSPQTIVTGTGKIILQYASIVSSLVNKNYVYDAASQRIFQRVSGDNGGTWSAPVEITSSLKDVSAAYIRNHAGHGIALQFATYKNRLVMPLTYSSNVVKVAISDDEGQTWRLSQAVNGKSLQYGSIVELSDGRLMMIVGHTNSTPKSKLVSYSSDGGETWSATANIAGDVKTGDFGQLYPGVALKGKNNQIIFVNSSSRESDSETKNSPVYPVTPVIFTSADEGLTFGSQPLSNRVFYYGYNVPWGGMDAAVLDDGTVVVVGEGGVESPREGIVVYKK